MTIFRCAHHSESGLVGSRERSLAVDLEEELVVVDQDVVVEEGAEMVVAAHEGEEQDQVLLDPDWP